MEELITILKEQNYIGKPEIVGLLTLPSLYVSSQKKENFKEIIENQTIFLEITKPDTEYKINLLKYTGQLKSIFSTLKTEACLVSRLEVEPYYIIKMYQNENTKEIFGALIAYDIKKTPDGVWLKMWNRL